MTSPYFIYIADVYCPWCYGFGPIAKRITDENPDFPVHVIGGSLISRPMSLLDDVAAQPGLADFWREVERTTGRSLKGAIDAAETGRDVRMYSPGADEILTVLIKQAPGHELEQMLMLEDMFYGQGLDLFTDQTLAAIAVKWNLNPQAFESALDQPAALQATERALAEAARLMGDAPSYPTLMLINNGKAATVSRGYMRYQSVAMGLAEAMAKLGVSDAMQCSRQNGCTTGRH